MASGPTRENPPQNKRRRLAVSCDQCRKQKIRCDTLPVICRPCRKKGLQCISTDIRTGLTVPRQATRASTPPTRPQLITQSQDLSGRDIWKSPSTAAGASEEDFLLGSSQSIDQHLITTTANSHVTTGGCPTEDSPEVFDHGSDEPFLTANRNVIEDSLVHNTDGRDRFAALGPSNVQFLVAGWVDKYFASHGLDYRLSEPFKYGLSHAVEGGWSHNIRNETASSLSLEAKQARAAAYLAYVHPLFPVVDDGVLEGQISRLESYVNSASPEQRSFSAVLLLVMSLGADELGKGVTAEGTSLLHQAYALLPDLMNYPFIASVQALTLMTLAYRARGRDGQAYLLLGIGVRMAQSLGLHQHCSHQQKTPVIPRPFADLARRIWASLFCLDAMLSLESGKSNVNNESICEFGCFSPSATPASSHGVAIYFEYHVKLCRIIRSLRLQDAHLWNDDIHETRKRRLEQSLVIISALRKWHKEFPDELTLPSNYPEGQYFSSYLMSLYHQGIIWANWIPLATNSDAYRSEISQHWPKRHKSYHRLLSGETECSTSATEIIIIYSRLMENDIPTRLIPISRVSCAVVVLTVLLLKDSRSMMSEAFLAYLHIGCKFAARLYDRIGQDPKFSSSWKKWYTTISDHINTRKTLPPMANSSAVPRPSTPKDGFNEMDYLTDGANPEVDVSQTAFLSGLSSFTIEECWWMNPEWTEALWFDSIA